MNMEPSGQMDGGRLQLHSASSKTGDYNVFDMADEEVHFTRNPLPGHPMPYSMASPNILGSPPYSPTGTSFTEVSLKRLQESSPVSAEQVKSTKLLNCIGSKLRRGSNYLVAPTLVGQYLLGITIRGWAEFLNTSCMMKAPGNTQQLTRRLMSNLNYFQGNYLCVSLVLVIYCILTSPLLLLAIAAYVIALYFVTARSAVGRPVKFLGYKPNLQQQYSFLTLVSLPLLWVAGAPSALFWVIGASFVVVGLHASMYSAEKAPELPCEQVASVGYSSVPVPYYNHYPKIAANQQQYISLPTTLARTTSSRQQPSGSNFSHWTIFGGGSRQASLSHGRRDQATAGEQKASRLVGGSQQTWQRVPEVTIISQDFAGLGRVYEV